jgi:hypothetical protein
VRRVIPLLTSLGAGQLQLLLRLLFTWQRGVTIGEVDLSDGLDDGLSAEDVVLRQDEIEAAYIEARAELMVEVESALSVSAALHCTVLYCTVLVTVDLIPTVLSCLVLC